MNKSKKSNGEENDANFTGEWERHLHAFMKSRSMGFLNFPYQMLCFNYHLRNIVSNLSLLKYPGPDELSTFI